VLNPLILTSVEVTVTTLEVTTITLLELVRICSSAAFKGEVGCQVEGDGDGETCDATATDDGPPGGGPPGGGGPPAG